MRLFDYQQRALEHVAGKTHCAFYHDMGLGKTYTGSEKLRSLKFRVNLVVCQKSKINDWIEHFKSNYPEWNVYDLTNKVESTFYYWGAIDPQENYREDQPQVGVINYDLVWRRNGLLDLEGFAVMFDESSLLQNPTSKRTKFSMRIAEKASAVVLLSGTPTDGKYEQLWTQMHMLGWKISHGMFWQHYVDFEWDTSEGFPIKKVKGYKNEDRLVKKMKSCGCDFLKTEEVLELPEQRFVTVKVRWTREYANFARDGIVEVEGKEFVGDSTFADMLNRRLLAGAYSRNKLNAFADVLDSTNDRMVVFYNFNDELSELKKIAEGKNRLYSEVNGSAHDLTLFEENDNAIVFVQYQAGAMGLNLQAAHYAVYFSPPLMSSLFEQSKKRIHRVGQDLPCTYYMLVSDKTIEQQIYATLAKRKDYTEQLFERSAKL